MIDINKNKKVCTISGNKEEIENEVCSLIEALIKSGMFEDYEIITSICCGFFACNKEKDFLKYATLLNAFDFSKLERFNSEVIVKILNAEEGE